MDTNNTHHQIPLFVGGPIEEPGELALIARLRRDLAKLGVKAVLYANFVASGRKGQRQIDLFVRTEHRLAHVETKDLDPSMPVRGPVNGPWSQVAHDGPERRHDGNYHQQALDGTFAIGDQMKKLARRELVPDAGHFPKTIDTNLCIWERIPDGSTIEKRDHVTVCGYHELLERLQRPGPTPPWDESDWETWARTLNLYQFDEDWATENQRLLHLAHVDEYRSHLSKAVAEDLDELVVVPHVSRGLDEDARPLLDQLDDRLLDGHVLGLRGPSGAGKTFHGQHVVHRHCAAGRLVIMARCADYESSLSRLLARSMAPYSARPWQELVRAAAAGGVGITMIVDALNDCPADRREQLLRELSAFRHRYHCGALLTSTEPFPTGPMSIADVAVQQPDDAARARILHVHGARTERLRDAFTTPYELAVAAVCEAELPESATTADLFDAYIRRFATEQQRRHLTAIAWFMHDRITPSISLLEVSAMLARGGVEPGEIDDLLTCQLVAVSGSRIRFSHETLQRYLAAEHLVRTSGSGDDLGRVLEAPANSALREFAVALELDVGRRWEAMARLGDARWYASALTGGFGENAAADADRRSRDVLRRAAAITSSADPTLDVDKVGWHATWSDVPELDAADVAILRAAGMALVSGWWAEEIVQLLDATDEQCRRAVHDLAAAGVGRAVSPVVQATYTQTAGQLTCLPASYLAHGPLWEFGPVFSDRGTDAVAKLLENAGKQSWGRYYVAASLLSPETTGDVNLLPDLLRRGWEAQGYHLRLQVLDAARRFVSTCTASVRDEVVTFLEGVEPSGNVFLDSDVVETLACYGAVESTVTVDDIHHAVDAVLALPPGEDASKLALGLFSSQFEPEDIVGPYSEAFVALDEDKLIDLLCRAVAGDPDMFTHNWAVERLARHLTSDNDEVAAAIAPFLRPPVMGNFMPSQAIETWWAALSGWAAAGLAYPDLEAETALDRAWVDVGAFLHALAQGADPSWPYALRDSKAETATVVTSLRWAPNRPRSMRTSSSALEFLFAAVPAELRALFEWVISHPTSIETPHPFMREEAVSFAITSLGTVGTVASVPPLEQYLPDPDLGAIAASAIASIRSRADG